MDNKQEFVLIELQSILYYKYLNLTIHLKMVQILDRDNCFCCQWRWYLRNIINIRNIIDIRYITNVRGGSKQQRVYMDTIKKTRSNTMILPLLIILYIIEGYLTHV